MKRPLLITAGATRNPIDSMRFISANASGKTGIWLGKQCSNHFDVHILGSSLALSKAPSSLSVEEFFSTADLLNRMQRWIKTHPNGVVIHSAAVGDFECKDASLGKISSGSSITLELIPTPKILDKIKQWASTSFLISFKAAAPETNLDQLIAIASAQAKRTSSDIVFANVIGNIQNQCILVEKQENTLCTTRQEALDLLLEKITLQR